MNEGHVSALLERRWECTIYKTPDLCVVDRMAVSNGRTMGWIEIKCRTNDFNKYPTYMISARKIQGGISLWEATRMPFILVVSWADGIRWLNVSQMYPQRVGGRYDRNDAQDVEMVCDIPLSADWRKVS